MPNAGPWQELLDDAAVFVCMTSLFGSHKKGLRTKHIAIFTIFAIFIFVDNFFSANPESSIKL